MRGIRAKKVTTENIQKNTEDEPKFRQRRRSSYWDD
jgi:hypothetical protein